jgi:hypothetical protein
MPNRRESAASSAGTSSASLIDRGHQAPCTKPQDRCAGFNRNRKAPIAGRCAPAAPMCSVVADMCCLSDRAVRGSSLKIRSGVHCSRVISFTGERLFGRHGRARLYGGTGSDHRPGRRRDTNAYWRGRNESTIVAATAVADRARQSMRLAPTIPTSALESCWTTSMVVWIPVTALP